MVLTIDREAATLVADQIGRTQGLTPEGYLLCTGVRIASTSPLLYAPEELPKIDPGDESMIIALRSPEVLFHPDCIASASGKPITLDHPPRKGDDGLVSPETWKEDSVGVMLNPRKGEDLDTGHLVADFLVTDRDGIDAVRLGTRQISLGYDCEYEQIRPGMCRQVQILINHAAILPRGRCGPSCSIGDSKMAKTSIRDRLLAAFTLGDRNAFERLVDEAPPEPDQGGGPVVVHVHNQPGESSANDEPTDPLGKLTKAVGAIGDGMAKLSDTIAEHGKKFAAYDERWAKMDAEAEAKAKEGQKEPDDDNKGDATKDSSELVDAYRAAITKAEILAPGGKSIPSFDSKAPMKDTRQSLCDFRRATLTRALADAKRAPFVDRAFGGRKVDLAKLPCGEVAIAFDAAAEFARIENNEAARPKVDVAALQTGPMTVEKFQKLLEERRKTM